MTPRSTVSRAGVNRGEPRILSAEPPRGAITLAYGPDPNQFGELWLPARAALADSTGSPLLVFLHGGYWRARYDLHHASFLCQALAATGVAVWNVEYRRLGQAGGGWPGTFCDVLAGIAFVRQLARHFPVDGRRVVLMGHSAGGHLALWAAGALRSPSAGLAVPPDPPPLAAVICMGGVTDLRRAWQLALSDQVVAELLGGSPDQVPERYAAASPIERLPLGVAQVLVHGTAEEVVRAEFATAYAAAARLAGDPVELVWLPGMGHFEALDPRSPAWPVVSSIVARRLAPTEP